MHHFFVQVSNVSLFNFQCSVLYFAFSHKSFDIEIEIIDKLSEVIFPLSPFGHLSHYKEPCAVIDNSRQYSIDYIRQYLQS